MQLSLHTDYALRVLLYLGANPGQRVTLNEIAEVYDISKEHLRKVVHTLGKLGVIKTFRGKQGGFELGRQPELVNIGEVIEATEPRKPVIDCASQPCVLSAACRLQGALAKAEAAFYDTLKQYTLSDLLKSRSVKTILRAPMH